MDRRAVLRLLGVGATGVPGCLGADSGGPETTTDRVATAGTTSTTAETTTERTTTAEVTTQTEETTEIGSCPPAVIADPRRHVHQDYGLGIVADESDDPAVAVVGEEWRSTLRTDEMSDADRQFVSDTDFEEFVVLVVQSRKASGGHDLRVTDATIDGDALLADVCVVADGATQDSPTENLFVRIPYAGTPPAQARVRIHRPRGTVTVTSA